MVNSNLYVAKEVDADGIAGMSYMMASDDPYKSSKKIKEKMSYYFEKNNIYNKNNIDKIRRCW
ncbi:hypothetical protein [Inediibacterium massiliense]|uniref:hypothetical protein n=1 Tax=Inediibacterium massiliense TaxID=1658111 RepID=UPI001A9A5436|nr:hypothetical protein [Inediibacterium massiliense]